MLQYETFISAEVLEIQYRIIGPNRCLKGWEEVKEVLWSFCRICSITQIGWLVEIGGSEAEQKYTNFSYSQNYFLMSSKKQCIVNRL